MRGEKVVPAAAVGDIDGLVMPAVVVMKLGSGEEGGGCGCCGSGGWWCAAVEWLLSWMVGSGVKVVQWCWCDKGGGVVQLSESTLMERKEFKTCLKRTRRPPKARKKFKSLALKARKLSSDEEVSCSDSDDEEYAMAVRDFKKFFRRRGKFVRQPYDDKKNFRKIKEDKKEKEDRSDSEEDSKKDEIYLMVLENNEALSNTPYYSSSSLDSEILQNEYNKLCKISLRIIKKNKHLKAKTNC
nr:zf-CCHC domain-containing protein/UBN2 domain-containing protein [Tanacetum cinerariifolium]